MSVILNSKYVFFVLAFFLIVACDKINIFSKPYVATVNDAKIYLDEYQARLNQKMPMLPKDLLLNQSNSKRIEEQVLDGMITEKIMLLRAKELNISVSSGEFDAKLSEIMKDYGEGFANLLVQANVSYDDWKDDIKKEMLIKKLVAVDVNANIRVSEDEAEDYFNENRNSYKMESRAKVSQIVVSDLAKAREVEARLNAGADFATVAKEMSIAPEASQGGDLGFITRQIMPEPLDDTIFKLPVNKVSPVVQSNYGFHVFKVLAIQSAKIGNFADMKEEVVAQIRAQKEDAAFTSWIEALKMKAVIKKESTVLREKIEKRK
ncbi:MAG: peptidyl-prolyl cis-trans isomerase [Deltaproteobacteria bacterium]